MAHARRKFVDVFKSQGSAIAEEARSPDGYVYPKNLSQWSPSIERELWPKMGDGS